MDEFGVGTAIEKISLLSTCPEVARRDCTWNVFKLCCLCSSHVVPKLSEVSITSDRVRTTFSLDLLGIEPEGPFFTNPDSMSFCLELLETFCDRTLQSEYISWESVDIHGYEKIRSDLEKQCEAVRVASDMETSSLSELVFVPDKLPEHCRGPAQCPRIDILKTHNSNVANLLTDKLRSKRRTSDAESSIIFE